MKLDARILVATTVIGDAELVRELVREEFNNVAISTDPERAVQDFEKHRPEVLILAFNTLEKAERYYLGLYRLSTLVHIQPHRTLILCNKDDLRRVYGLCKKEYFDDYILFWPGIYDATRLHMAIHHALRQLVTASTDAPSAGEIAAQARNIAGLESLLDQYGTKAGERIEVAGRSLRQAERDIGTALDGFSRKLSDGELPDLVEIKDRARFQEEIDRLKAHEIEKHFQSVSAAVGPMQNWVEDFRQEVAPHIESARQLKAMAERIRPVILVVDDDPFQHKLLGQILEHENLELVYAESGAGALGVLRRRRPDLILMDVRMPDIDGIEVTRRLKAAAPFAGIPIVMITGQGEKNTVVESQKAGAVDFVVKPFNRDTLIAKMHKYLGGTTDPSM